MKKKFEMKLANLNDMKLSPEILCLIPKDVARRFLVVPVAVFNGVITLAMDDPFDFDALAKLQSILKCKVEGVLATRDSLKTLIARHYGKD